MALGWHNASFHNGVLSVVNVQHKTDSEFLREMKSQNVEKRRTESSEVQPANVNEQVWNLTAKM